MTTMSETHKAKSSTNPNPAFDLREYLPMVRFVARNIHRRIPQNLDIEDLYAAGLLGLWDAYAKFNPLKCVRFASYAQFRVRGAILDSLRAGDWAPRMLRSKGRAIQEAARTLTARFGRVPTEDEVATELKLSLEEYQSLLGDLHGLEIGTLHRASDDDSGDETLVSIPGPLEDDPLFKCLRGEITERLKVAIENLPENERLVMTLYYYEELTRREISVALGINESRVQQIRTSAIVHLRVALSDFARKATKSPEPTHRNQTRSQRHSFQLGSAA